MNNVPQCRRAREAYYAEGLTWLFNDTSIEELLGSEEFNSEETARIYKSWKKYSSANLRWEIIKKRYHISIRE